MGRLAGLDRQVYADSRQRESRRSQPEFLAKGRASRSVWGSVEDLASD
jgi:hypothetical protein